MAKYLGYLEELFNFLVLLSIVGNSTDFLQITAPLQIIRIYVVFQNRLQNRLRAALTMNQNVFI